MASKRRGQETTEKPESLDFDQMLKEAHPDNGGSQEELQNVVRLREKRREQKQGEKLIDNVLDKGKNVYKSLTENIPKIPQNIPVNNYFEDISSSLLKKEEKQDEETRTPELPEPSIETEIQEEYQKLLEINGFQPEHVLEAQEYQGNTQLARKALEAEWKLANSLKYLNWENFSQSSLSGEAELILTEYTEEQRQKLVEKLAESSSEEYGEITKTWTQHGHLMGYSTEKGHTVKLVDSYEKLDQRIENRENSLRDMLQETRDQIDEYGKAAVKSIFDPEVNGEINDQELLRYTENKINKE